MTRLTSLENVTFPVQSRPLYSDIEVAGHHKQMAIDSHKVLFNVISGKALSVVSRDYQVVTNEQAVEMGKRCCRELFGLDEAADLEVFSVDAPSTGSYCFIDLVHKGYTMNLWDSGQKPEVYIPYVRVTNSYNRTRALKFDIGFCRKICFNGVIFERQTISFTFSHVRHELQPSAIKFDIKKGLLEKLINEFRHLTKTVKETEIPLDYAFQIVSGVLGIPDEEAAKNEKNPERMAETLRLVNQCRETVDRYLGENGYAVFNAMTDIASHVRPCRVFPREKNAMQRLAGEWLRDFHRRAALGPLEWDNYLQRIKENQWRERPNGFQRGAVSQALS